MRPQPPNTGVQRMSLRSTADAESFGAIRLRRVFVWKD
jgi:hypothetical protein